MTNVVVAGMQWGDEGKGKIVDLLCPAFDAVVRFQGGNNAGHTVKFGDRHFALHLIPSGILHPGVRCVLGHGMVIDPEALFQELESLAGSGVETGSLHVAARAHVILPLHTALDRVREKARGDDPIGTTARGIGPAYEMKAGRLGLRICDLGAEDLEERLEAIRRRASRELEEVPALEELAARCREWDERLRPFVRETSQLLNRWCEEGLSLFFEGAQGALLDLDMGTYPYVTSSSSTCGGACTGTGVPPTRIDGVVGVLKAYTSRVGEGPFPTELSGEEADYLRERGNEYGTTTGRPRRCGWLDAVAARYARRVNGVGGIALTKLDVLDQMEEIRVCVGYRIDGDVRRELPPDLATLRRAEPVLKTLPGWRRDTVGTLEMEDLPPAARDYVTFIEEQVGAPVSLLSTGPRREETIIRRKGFLADLLGPRLDRVVAGRASA